MIAQNSKNWVLIPARMPEFEGVAVITGKHSHKTCEPFAVGMKSARQLKEHGPAFRAENRETTRHQFDRVLRSSRQTLPMGDELRGLPSKAETCRRPIPPAFDRLNRWRAVERAIDFR